MQPVPAASAVDGTDALLTARQITVGREGSGMLTIRNGARVETTLQAPPIGNSFGLSVGTEVGSTGTINVTSGGQLLVTGNDLRVGEGGTGALFINNGGVTAGRDVVIGAAASGKGDVQSATAAPRVAAGQHR